MFVEDLDPNQTVSSLQDFSQVRIGYVHHINHVLIDAIQLQRFELTEEQYDARENTLRKWKQQQEKEGKKVLIITFSNLSYNRAILLVFFNLI